jgi:hypothetical protein
MQIAKTCSEEIVCLASRTLSENRVAVFIVAYNAEGHIETVLERIPDWVSEKLTEVFIIYDSSKDGTLNWNGLFGYQILIEATRSDSAETLIARTFLDQRESQIQSCTVSNSPIPAAHQ